MFLIEIIFIGIGLAMDSFAVSIANGIKVKEIKIKYSLKIALAFGFFQAFMPLVGWLIGSTLKVFISSVDHWIAFILLGLIGIKMIYESFKIKDEKQPQLLSNKILVLQSVATSIDALIVGTSLAFLNFPIIISVVLIGLITFMFSFSGVYIGKRFGSFLESKAEIAGGLILIAIGLKILISHLIFI
jgi:manganese efflux pump family protein